jgi:hypothetical protein
MRSLIVLTLFILFLGAFAGFCAPDENDWVNTFYGAVRNCTEDPNQALKLRSLLSNNMIWASADNITFVGPDIFTIYTCYPHVGVNLASWTPIIQYCDFIESINGQPIVEHHISTTNFLNYNLTRNVVNPSAAFTPTTTFFKENDDFKLTFNPSWTFWSNSSVPKYLLTYLSSAASPRDFYIKLSLIPPTTPTKKRSDTIPPYWAFQAPVGTTISSAPVNLTQMIGLY